MSEVIGYVGKPEPLKEEPVIIDVEATVVETAPVVEEPVVEEKPKAKKSTKK